jgi:hypothetical protein
MASNPHPKLSREQRNQMRERAIALLSHGPGPEQPRLQPAPDDAGEVFHASALGQPLSLAERYQMPNGKFLWVHPASVEEEIWINVQAANEVRKLVEDGAKLSPAVEQYQSLVRGRVYQVLCVCRTGQEPGSPLVFSVADAARLRTNPAYRAAVKEICAISDRLSGDEFTRSAFESFFGGLEERLAVLSTSLNEVTCRRGLARLRSSIKLTRQLKTLSPSLLPDLFTLGAPPEEENRPQVEADPALN